MTDPRKLALDVRNLAHRAVTEGVNLKYVDQMRKALYEASDELLAALDREDALEAELARKTRTLKRVEDIDPGEWSFGQGWECVSLIRRLVRASLVEAAKEET
jgi:hypothetical protein